MERLLPHSVIGQGVKPLLLILLKNPLAFEFESEEAIFC
jgi:hypothetical protein